MEHILYLMTVEYKQEEEEEWGGGGGDHDKLCKLLWGVNIFSAPEMDCPQNW